MTAELRRAHQANDRAVDAAYGYRGDRADAPRVANVRAVSAADQPAARAQGIAQPGGLTLTGQTLLPTDGGGSEGETLHHRAATPA